MKTIQKISEKNHNEDYEIVPKTIRENIDKYQPCDFGSHFGVICLNLFPGHSVLFYLFFLSLRGAPPRAISDVKIEQKDAKDTKWNAKRCQMIQNNHPARSKSTQIPITALINPRKSKKSSL